ncbi:MAG TPA: hypothetical protein DCY79_03350, partial [Planctomycetaceae bacterium]|nr:hypothetical protein [Planctomycetaceae bacterium]
DEGKTRARKKRARLQAAGGCLLWMKPEGFPIQRAPLSANALEHLFWWILHGALLSWVTEKGG